MTEHQQGTAPKSPHVHRWVDKALLHEPPLKVCECGATMTDTEYRDSPNRDERDRAPISQDDLDLLKTALIRTEHSRRCEGFYRCTCIVGKADEALKRIEEAVRARV